MAWSAAATAWYSARRSAGGTAARPLGLVSTCTSVVGHLCVAVREADVARRQVRARLQMAEADDDEVDHTEKLMDISARRLDGALFFADAAEALPQDVEKIEAAVQGLRKCWLRRPLCPRCDRCGVRHEDIEFGTCKFWVKSLAEPEPEMPEYSLEDEEEEPRLEEVDEPSRIVEVGRAESNASVNNFLDAYQKGKEEGVVV